MIQVRVGKSEGKSVNGIPLRIEDFLRRSLASKQGLTVLIEMVGRRVLGEERTLNGELLSARLNERGAVNFISFEVRHPGGTGGIRKTYVFADAETVQRFEQWTNDTSDDYFERLIVGKKKICPGLKLDCPY